MTKQLYSFHPIAVEQQTQIWLYTYNTWGAAQADKYIDELHTYLAKVAKDSSLLRNVPDKIIKGVKYFHYKHHYIFVRQAITSRPEIIQVLTILHDSMDIPTRLREILEEN